MKRLNRLRWLLTITLVIWCTIFIVSIAQATDATVAPNPKFTATDANGNPYVGGKLYTYETGTITPKTTWTSSDKGAVNTNPIILDSRGQANVWIDSSAGAYRFRFTDCNDVYIWHKDGIKVVIESEGAILGDGYIGRVLRSSYLCIRDGTSAATIKITLYGLFNGDQVATVDNIGKGSNTTYFNLNATGNFLSLNDAVFTGALVDLVSFGMRKNATGMGLCASLSTSGTGITVILYDNNGSAKDITTLVDVGPIQITFSYITDE